jgi:hypothetical protein
MSKRQESGHNMNRFLAWLGITAAALILLAIASESVYFSNFEYRYRTHRFNRILHAKDL